MSTSAISTTSPVVDSSSRLAPVWRVGAVAAIAAAAGAELCAVVARAVDVPMRAGNPGASTAEAIPAGGFATATLMMTVIGTVLAVVLARRAQRPARTFVVTTVALTVVSMITPIIAGSTTTATRVTLGLGHVVAAAIFVPLMARRLRQSHDAR